MSVMPIKEGLFLDVAASIRDDVHVRDYYESPEDRLDEQIYKLSEEDKIVSLYAWAERLYISHQLALAFNDSRPLQQVTVSRFTKSEHDGRRLEMLELFNAAKHIRYNLYTNVGRCFTNEEDMDKLDRVIEAAATMVLQENVNPNKEELPRAWTD